MTTLTESAIFEEGIFQLEKSTPPLGGAPVFNGSTPTQGHANAQAQQLGNRTTWLKQQVETFKSDLASSLDTMKGASLIGTKHPSTLSVGRNLNSKLYDTVSIKDFGAKGDGVTDDYAAIQAAFNWAQLAVAGTRRGVGLYFPYGVYLMSQLATCNIAPLGVPGTGMVGISIEGDGDTETVFVATPTNTTGCIRLTSGRNTECFRVMNCAFLSDLNEDAAANNGIALQIDSQLEKGSPGYGDHPRWSVLVENVFIGGYGQAAGDLARRGNWKKGIYVANKWYAQFKNVRCLARYTGTLGARTASDYAIHLYNCYSPDFSDIYIHGGWDNGIFLGDILDAENGGWEDFRIFNSFCVGPNKGITIDHPYTDTTIVRLTEPGGCISGLHLNCRQFGLTIRNHRQVMIDGVYGYAPNSDRAQGELLPSVILLDGAADIRIKAQILEPGFYNSNTNACVGVRIEGNTESVTLDLQLGCGGIGILNNSTSANKTIVADLPLITSRRNSAWVAPLIPIVDNAGGVNSITNTLGTTQDKITFSNSKTNAATYPIAIRLNSTKSGQLIGGSYEISGLNSAGTTVNQFILNARFSTNTAGAEESNARFYTLSAGGVKEVLRLSSPGVDNETYATLLIRTGGADVFKRVLVGAADSGGTGYRLLRVTN